MAVPRFRLGILSLEAVRHVRQNRCNHHKWSTNREPDRLARRWDSLATIPRHPVVDEPLRLCGEVPSLWPAVNEGSARALHTRAFPIS